MSKKSELQQLQQERNDFIDQANARIAWYNGRIHQLQQQTGLRGWWWKLWAKKSGETSDAA